MEKWGYQNQLESLLVFLSHCKVSFDSPCCESICGKGNHCNCNIDTHEYVISDSDEEHIEKTITPTAKHSVEGR